MRNFVDIQKLALTCEYVDKWLQTINIVIHNPKITQLVAPIHFYTYEQSLLLLLLKLTNNQKTSRNRSIAEYL